MMIFVSLSHGTKRVLLLTSMKKFGFAKNFQTYEDALDSSIAQKSDFFYVLSVLSPSTRLSDVICIISTLNME